jgi:hypothetical protein
MKYLTIWRHMSLYRAVRYEFLCQPPSGLVSERRIAGFWQAGVRSRASGVADFTGTPTEFGTVGSVTQVAAYLTSATRTDAGTSLM